MRVDKMAEDFLGNNLMTKIEKLRWEYKPITNFLEYALLKIRRQKHLAGERSPFWIFIHDWPKKKRSGSPISSGVLIVLNP